MNTSLLFVGFCSRSDSEISSMQGKEEENKARTSIQDGDVLTLETHEDKTYVKKIEKTDKKSCIYGVAVNGIVKYTVPVLLRGHVIAHLETNIFDDIKIGEYLGCPRGKGTCECCKILVVRKLKGLKNEKKVDCYEVFVQ